MNILYPYINILHAYMYILYPYMNMFFHRNENANVVPVSKLERGDYKSNVTL